ncbi:MAG: glycosyltransferase [Deltaproteobacteria bacterium]|nr:glycosyltransferase [Deltaproteobacteria bacterium]
MRFSQDADVAFVIPTRNRRDRLLATLERLGETPGPDVEVVVADNASDDGTVEAVREAHPHVRVLALDSNRESMARNVAAQATGARVIVMLDDDSYPEEGATEALARALEDPSLGIAAAMVRLPDGIREEGGAPHVPIGCGMALRRADFLALGGFAPYYGTYVEEYDLAIRMLDRGLRVEYLHNAVVTHEQGERASFDFLVGRLMRNNVYLAYRFFPDADAQRFADWACKRYAVLADQKGAKEGYLNALSQVKKAVKDGRRDRFDLADEATLDMVFPYRLARRRIAEALPDDARPVVFLRAGKEINDLIAAARSLDHDVFAVYDDGLLSRLREIDGVPVRPIADFVSFDEHLVIGGLSPGFIENTKRLAVGTDWPTPVALDGSE